MRSAYEIGRLEVELGLVPGLMSPEYIESRSDAKRCPVGSHWVKDKRVEGGGYCRKGGDTRTKSRSKRGRGGRSKKGGVGAAIGTAIAAGVAGAATTRGKKGKGTPLVTTTSSQKNKYTTAAGIGAIAGIGVAGGASAAKVLLKQEQQKAIDTVTKEGVDRMAQVESKYKQEITQLQEEKAAVQSDLGKTLEFAHHQFSSRRRLEQVVKAKEKLLNGIQQRLVENQAQVANTVAALNQRKVPTAVIPLPQNTTVPMKVSPPSSTMAVGQQQLPTTAWANRKIAQQAAQQAAQSDPTMAVGNQLPSTMAVGNQLPSTMAVGNQLSATTPVVQSAAQTATSQWNPPASWTAPASTPVIQSANEQKKNISKQFNAIEEALRLSEDELKKSNDREQVLVHQVESLRKQEEEQNQVIAAEQGKNKVLEERLQASEKQVVELNQQNNNLKKERGDLSAQVKQINSERDNLSKISAERQQEIDNLRSQGSERGEELKAAISAQKDLEREAKSTDKQQKKLERELKAKDKALKENEAALSSARVQIESDKKDLDNNQVVIREAQQKLTESQSALEKTSEEARQLQIEVQEKTRSLQELNDTVESAKRDIETRNKEIENFQKQLTDNDSELAGLQKSLSESEAQTAQLQQQLIERRETVEELNARLQTSESQRGEQDQEIQNLRRRLEEQDRAIQGQAFEIASIREQSEANIDQRVEARVAEISKAKQEEMQGELDRMSKELAAKLEQAEQQYAKENQPTPQQGFNRRNFVISPDRGLHLGASLERGVNVNRGKLEGASEKLVEEIAKTEEAKISRRFIDDLNRVVNGNKSLTEELASPDVFKNAVDNLAKQAGDSIRVVSALNKALEGSDVALTAEFSSPEGIIQSTEAAMGNRRSSRNREENRQFVKEAFTKAAALERGMIDYEESSSQWEKDVALLQDELIESYDKSFAKFAAIQGLVSKYNKKLEQFDTQIQEVQQYSNERYQEAFNIVEDDNFVSNQLIRGFDQESQKIAQAVRQRVRKAERATRGDNYHLAYMDAAGGCKKGEHLVKPKRGKPYCRATKKGSGALKSVAAGAAGGLATAAAVGAGAAIAANRQKQKIKKQVVKATKTAGKVGAVAGITGGVAAAGSVAARKQRSQQRSLEDIEREVNSGEDYKKLKEEAPSSEKAGSASEEVEKELEQLKAQQAGSSSGNKRRTRKRSSAKQDADDRYSPPEQARVNARRALKMREESPPSNRGMLPVGLARARDLANGKNLSYNTVKRMAQFNRHRKNYKPGQNTRGTQAWLGWGGTEGIDWAIRIVEKEERGDGLGKLQGLGAELAMSK